MTADTIKENHPMAKFSIGDLVTMNNSNYQWEVKSFHWTYGRKLGRYTYELANPSNIFNYTRWADEKILKKVTEPPFKPGYFVSWWNVDPGPNYRRVNVTPADE